MLLQDFTPVSTSKLWDLQAGFYMQQGPEAWSEQRVPQGSTANCFTADTYAAIVAELLHDLANQGCEQELLIIELGGGNGRFAWQFMQRLMHYHLSEDEAETLPGFQYLLTDGAEKNLTSWQQSARFKSLTEQGLLAFGTLMVNADPVIHTIDGELRPQDLRDRPVVLIANYLFDSLPIDVYRIKDQQLHRQLVSLSTDDESLIEGRPRSFENLQADFKSEPIDAPGTGDELMDSIIMDYTEFVEDFCVPVPVESFKFLHTFLDREAPLLLLTGDLAYSEPDEFPPEHPFIFDSYMAHYSNFHLFEELFVRSGGNVQLQRQKDIDFCAGAFFYPGPTIGDEIPYFPATMRGARLQLEEFNPYDAHEINELMEETIEEASFRQVFAWLRFARFDPKIAQACLPLLFAEIQRDDEELDKDQLYQIYRESYSLFFPDGSEVTFDYGVVQLLLAIHYDNEALEVIEASLQEFGRKPARLYVYALVLLRLQRKAEAKQVLQEALAEEADYGPALRLYDQEFGETKAQDEADIAHLVARYSDSSVLKRSIDVFNENGAVLIEDMFPQDMMQELYTSFMQRFEDWKKAGLGDPNFVGNKRYTVPLRIQAPFNDPRLWANPVLLDLLTEVMGARPILNAFGSVVTYAGANTQHVHREHPLLFEDVEANRGLPTHAVTILVPLVDLNEELGGTQLWEGTNKAVEIDEPEGEPTVVYTRKGSMLVFDYSTFHGGLASRSDDVRPVLFLTYSLPWFRDSMAFESHFALGITEKELDAIPAEHKDLFRFATKLAE